MIVRTMQQSCIYTLKAINFDGCKEFKARVVHTIIGTIVFTLSKHYIHISSTNLGKLVFSEGSLPFWMHENRLEETKTARDKLFIRYYISINMQ